jgi:hypothetical protein
MAAIMEHLRDSLPDDVILTNGAGNFAIWPNRFFRFSKQQRLLAPQSGAMGYGVPAAIAAKAEHRDRLVVCFAGDGDFQMNCQELGSAMQAGCQPVILILNNGTYGTIRMHQERTYPERVSGTELQNPDFVTLARAYGFHAERVETTADFAIRVRARMCIKDRRGAGPCCVCRGAVPAPDAEPDARAGQEGQGISRARPPALSCCRVPPVPSGQRGSTPAPEAPRNRCRPRG